MMHSEQELRDLLPWHVNHTLDADTCQEVEALAGRSPLVRAEIHWLEQLRSQIRQFRDEAEQRPDDAGLDMLLAMIHAEDAGKLVRLRGRWNAWLAAPRRYSVAGLAAAVVLAQAALIGALLQREAPETLTPLSGETAAGGELLQVTFKPRATEAQIRGLLAGLRAEIVSGPGALGVYTVRVPEGQGQPVLASLRGSSAIVESAALLAGR
ncbi:hypothetical protein ACEN8I_05660 [Polaromonas sp. CT11-55]|uniref:hypothetical protein n=1 Tax=Polaromonas sp. CT11-55 TaxID=3243045 RepID=UPI0039A43D56